MKLRQKRTPSALFFVRAESFGSPRRTRITKEEREALLLEELRRSGRGFPPGVVRRGEDREGKGPDFLVERPSEGAVAIEITELYLDDGRDSEKGSLRREQEGLRWAFVRRAEDAFYEGETIGGRATNVSFSWLPEDVGAAKLTPRLVRALAPSAAALVGRSLTGSAGALVELGEHDLRRAGLAGALRSIWIREALPFPDGRASPWCSSGPSFSRAALGIAPIESAITEKEGKLAGYRERCSEAWLLMAAMGGPSSFDDVADPVLVHPFQSIFERVMLLCPGAPPDRRTLALVGA